MKEAYLIEGMHCSSCVKAIHNEPGKLGGIRTFHVSLADSSLEIYYDGEVTIDQIKEAVKRAGYKLNDKYPWSARSQHDPVG
jgi:copper chaperone CopZ